MFSSKMKFEELVNAIQTEICRRKSKNPYKTSVHVLKADMRNGLHCSEKNENTRVGWAYEEKRNSLETSFVGFAEDLDIIQGIDTTGLTGLEELAALLVVAKLHSEILVMEVEEMEITGEVTKVIKIGRIRTAKVDRIKYAQLRERKTVCEPGKFAN